MERAQLRRAPVSRDRCARTRFGPLRSSCLIVDCEGCPLDTRAPPVRPFGGAVRRVPAVRVARRLSLLEELSQAHSAIDKKRLDGGSSPDSLWVGVRRSRLARALCTRVGGNSNLVDSASSHTLVSKIKPCMSKYKRSCTVKLRMAHYISYSLFDSPLLHGYP